MRHLTPTFALVGPPNAGKTTLFNWLTDSHFRAVNYPGSTVDCLVGETQPRYGAGLKVIDTPGIYGFQSHSPEEQITHKIIKREYSSLTPHSIIVCVDATQLERHLPLVLQIQSLAWPIIVAITMMDLVALSGSELNTLALSQKLSCPVISVDGRQGLGLEELLQAMQTLAKNDPQLAQPQHPQLTPLPREQANQQASDLLATIKKTISIESLTPHAKTAQVDRFLLHSFWGPLAFVLIMTSLFASVFWLANPAMEAIDYVFGQWGYWIHNVVRPLWLGDFLADGLIASFGAVIVFVPQIFILFFGLCILEDSGYLARAATLIDRPLAKLGLSGRAFVPLLSGYACAVPAIMAARTIRSPRERWLTIFILPLLSCSARLPVYSLLLSFLFINKPSWQPALALSMIYLGSMILGALGAGILNRLLQVMGPGQKKTSSFLMELPLYRSPQWKIAFKTATLRTQTYARRAGPVIFALALLLWLGTHFPRAQEGASASQTVQASYAGQLGHVIEPIFKPMGVDWRVGVGLISAFAAREVFVSAMALAFDVTVQEDQALRHSLLEVMKQARWPEGRPIFTHATVVGLIIFFMIALQCSSTTAMTAREMGSWRLAFIQLAVLNILAYTCAVFAVQLLTWI